MPANDALPAESPLERPAAVSRARSGVPIGGLGTGSFEIRSDGRFYEWMIFNNCPWVGRRTGVEASSPLTEQDTVLAVRIARPGQAPVLRLLQLPEADVFTQHHWHISENMYWMPWVKWVQDIRYRGEFPFAYLSYEDDALGIDLVLEAFSPFVPGSVKDSALPMAYLTFTATNRKKTPVDVSILVGLKNPVGAHSPERVPRSVVRTPEGRVEVEHVAEKVRLLDGTFGGGITLACLQPDATWTTGVESRHTNLLWAYFRRTGRLPSRPQQPEALELLAKFNELSPEEQSRVEREILAGMEIEPAYQDALHQDLAHPEAAGDRLTALLERMFERNLTFKAQFDHDLSWVGKTDVSAEERRDIMLKIISRHLGRDKAAAMLSGQVSLAPRRDGQVGFLLGWYFPNHRGMTPGETLGHRYQEWFASSADVVADGAARREELEGATKRFRDLFYASSAPTWFLDAVNAQFSTLPKSSYLMRDGRFGVWEGGPGCCGLQTLDVSYYWSPLLTLFFPELEAQQQRLSAEFQLAENSPEWATYAVAFVENRAKLEERIKADPTLAADAERKKTALREIVAETGRDPAGRMPHFFPATFMSVDAYHMIDLMPKFALQAYRDYLWTGDENLLRELWPHVKRAMDHDIQFDPADAGLLYHYDRRQTGTAISSQTYDAWDFLGYAAYTNSIWIAALRACEEIARRLGDADYGARATAMREKAEENFLKLLWNGEYLDLWNDPIDGHRDACCMADQLSGQWYATMCGLGRVLSRRKTASCLDAIMRYNFKADEGLINGAYPDGLRVSIEGELVYPDGTNRVWPIAGQADTPWTGTEYAVASLMLQEGMTESALAVVKHVFDRYHAAGLDWNHIECGGHYARAMVSWQVYMDLAGFRYDATSGRLALDPRGDGGRYRGIVVLPGAWIDVERSARKTKVDWTLRAERGEFSLRTLALVMPLGWRDVRAKATLDGQPVDMAPDVRKWNLDLIFPDGVRLAEGSELVVRLKEA